MIGTWVITISSDCPIAQTVQELTKAGCSVQDVLAEIGVVIARCDGNSVPALRQLSGVIDVSPETKIDVGPPNSPVTW